MTTLNLSPEAAAMLCRELDPLNIEFDVDGATIHLYPTVTVNTGDYVLAFSAALRSTTGVVWWQGGRPT